MHDEGLVYCVRLYLPPLKPYAFCPEDLMVWSTRCTFDVRESIYRMETEDCSPRSVFVIDRPRRTASRREGEMHPGASRQPSGLYFPEGRHHTLGGGQEGTELGFLKFDQEYYNPCIRVLYKPWIDYGVVA